MLVPQVLRFLQHFRQNLRSYQQSQSQAGNDDSLHTALDSENISRYARYRKALKQASTAIINNTLYCATKFSEYALPIYIHLETIAVLLFRVLYIFKLTPYHHPWFAICGMKLVKNRHVQRSIESENNVKQNNWPLQMIFAIIFAMRGIDWWVNNDLSSEHLSTRLTHKVALPSPPLPSKVASGCLIPPNDSTLCPICLKKRNNSCAATSGYVFCYTCILEEVRANGCCPITKLPCQEKDLIRLYESNV